MFVFPILNKEYKSRKRNYLCCNTCRSRRTKCELFKDYEVEGCKGCKRRNFECSLVKRIKHNPDGKLRNEEKDQENKPEVPTTGDVFSDVDTGDHTSNSLEFKHHVNGITPAPTTSESIDSHHSSTLSKTIDDKRSSTLYDSQTSNPQASNPQTSNLESKHSNTPDCSKLDRPSNFINAQYLKEKHGFIISSPQLLTTFQDLCPQNSKRDQVFNEDNIIDDVKDFSRTNSVGYKEFQNPTKNFINHYTFYEFLESIHAFTLRSPYYLFEKDDIRYLLELYFCKLNSIFPIIPEERFWQDYDNNCCQTIIIFAIVALILRDSMAQSTLKKVFMRSRPFDSPDMDDNEFHKVFSCYMACLNFKIRQLINVLDDLNGTDSLTRIMVYLLLSLNLDSKLCGNDKSSNDVSSAVTELWSMESHRWSSFYSDSPLKEYFLTLSHCCFVFERICSMVNSKPIFSYKIQKGATLSNNMNLSSVIASCTLLESILSTMYSSSDIFDGSLENNAILNKIHALIEREFEVCQTEKDEGIPLYSYHPSPSRLVDLKGPLSSYKQNTTHFLCRIINNSLILISQKPCYDKKAHDLESTENIAIQASRNIYFYVTQMKNDWILNIPLVPWCVSLGLSVILKKYLRTKLNNLNSNTKAEEEEVQRYLDLLETFCSKFYVVSNLFNITKEVLHKLEQKYMNSNRDSSGMNDESFHDPNMFNLQEIDLDLFDQARFDDLNYILEHM